MKKKVLWTEDRIVICFLLSNDLCFTGSEGVFQEVKYAILKNSPPNTVRFFINHSRKWPINQFDFFTVFLHKDSMVLLSSN
jgi:hypothetical protein